MLVPHRREDAELGERRLAADQLENALVFVRLEPVLGDQLGGDVRFVAGSQPMPPGRACSTSPANSPRPSVEPIAASTWFSGCGIMPSTLPRSLTMPAMALIAPLRFQFGSIMPSGDGIAEQHPPLAFQPRDGFAVGDVIALAMRDRHADHLPGIVAARERRVGALDPQIHVAADELAAAHCASARRAAARPRTAIWKPLQTPSTSPPLAAIAAHRVHDRRRAPRSRRSADNRRRRSRRDHHEIGAGRQLASRRARPSPARGRRPAERARHVALAIDAREKRGRRLSSQTRPLAVILDHGIGQQLVGGLLEQRPPPWRGRRLRSRCRRPCPGARWTRPPTPSERNAPSMALPWGSRMPDFRVTVTRAFIDSIAVD